MKLVVLLNSVEEVRYVTIKTAQIDPNLRIGQMVYEKNSIRSVFQISDGDFVAVYMLGFYTYQAQSLTRSGHDFNRFRVGNIELEDFIDNDFDTDYIQTYKIKEMEAYINFEDEKLVEPVINLYNRITPFTAEVLSEEADASGYIVHVRIKSSDPMAMFVLGQVFGNEYEKVS